MRLAIDCLVTLMLAGVLTGVVLLGRAGEDEQTILEQVSADVRRMHQQIMLQSALEQVPLTSTGFPVSIDPAWFHGDLPDNPLLGSQAAWVEVADKSQLNEVHPPNRVATDERTAEFWYNPWTGTVRARVPAGISDAEALSWYNTINGCDLASLFETAPDGSLSAP